MTLQEIIIMLAVALVCIIVTAVVASKVTASRLKKSADTSIGNAEENATEIMDEALKTADAKKRFVAYM